MCESAYSCGTSARSPSAWTHPSRCQASTSAGVAEAGLPASTPPTSRIVTGTPRSRNRRAACTNSCTPLSRSKRATIVTTTGGAGGSGSARHKSRSTPAPRMSTTCSSRTAPNDLSRSRSAPFWKITRLLRWPSARRYNRATTARTRRIFNEFDRNTKPSPEIAATMPGTRASRAAMPPYSTGLMVTKCTTCGRKRRNSRSSASKVPSSCNGCLPLRVIGMA